jgi:hypothetical protein
MHLRVSQADAGRLSKCLLDAGAGAWARVPGATSPASDRASRSQGHERDHAAHGDARVGIDSWGHERDHAAHGDARVGIDSWGHERDHAAHGDARV